MAEETASSHMEKLTVETIRPKVESFFEMISLGQWEMFTSGRLDEDTQRAVADLLFFILKDILKVVLRNLKGGFAVTENDVSSDIRDIVPRTFAVVLGIFENVEFDFSNVLTTLIAKEVMQNVTSCTIIDDRSGTRKRVCYFPVPKVNALMIIHAVRVLVCFSAIIRDKTDGSLRSMSKASNTDSAVRTDTARKVDHRADARASCLLKFVKALVDLTFRKANTICLEESTAPIHKRLFDKIWLEVKDVDVTSEKLKDLESNIYRDLCGKFKSPALVLAFMLMNDMSIDHVITTSVKKYLTSKPNAIVRFLRPFRS